VSKPTAAAAVTLKRPPAPITSSALEAALGPVLELLGLDNADDLAGLTVTPSRIRVQLKPRTRGRRQHDTLVRVSYPVVFDGGDT
jgi:hypothetical protein